VAKNLAYKLERKEENSQPKMKRLIKQLNLGRKN
jgi:hypothetical protein